MCKAIGAESFLALSFWPKFQLEELDLFSQNSRVSLVKQHPRHGYVLRTAHLQLVANVHRQLDVHADVCGYKGPRDVAFIGCAPLLRGDHSKSRKDERRLKRNFLFWLPTKPESRSEKRPQTCSFAGGIFPCSWIFICLQLSFYAYTLPIVSKRALIVCQKVSNVTKTSQLYAKELPAHNCWERSSIVHRNPPNYEQKSCICFCMTLVLKPWRP